MLQQIVEPFTIVAWAVFFYFSHLLIVALAVVPSAVRAYQMYTSRLTPGLEVIVEVARGILFLIIIVVGQPVEPGGLLTSDAWGNLIGDVFVFLGANWVQALIQYGLVLLIFGAINLLLGLLVTKRTIGALVAKSGAALDVPGATKAAAFAIKNMLVIPLFVICMFRIIHLI